jgi:hypothetical protein
VRPPTISNAPPFPTLALPTDSLILPLFPAIASPDAKNKDPERPFDAAPVLKDTLPLPPLEAAFPLLIEMEPELFVPLAPDKMWIFPPVDVILFPP